MSALSSVSPNPILIERLAALPAIISVKQAADAIGYKLSTLEKSFMRERPSYAPPPPPHRREGRAIRIFTHRLPEWLESLCAVECDERQAEPEKGAEKPKKRHSREPTPAEQEAWRKKQELLKRRRERAER
jgi:hypothetical protein